MFYKNIKVGMMDSDLYYIHLDEVQLVPRLEKVHALYVDINASLYDNKLDILSMGMSGDYEDAVRCGATMVRIGTAIFGARHYAL